MRLSSVIMLIGLVMAAASCSGRVDKEKEVLSSLLGREIVIPDSLVCRILDTPIDYDMSDADYKIITYIDSSGCTPCRMKLPLWNELINEFKSSEDVEVGFLMILNSASDKEIIFDIKRDAFLHPVVFDSDGLYDSANRLPAGDGYHTLLLDIDNRVVCVGNPVFNPKIRELYRQIITDSKRKTERGLVANPNCAIGIAHPHDSIQKQFLLVNQGSQPITIQEIVPSCDCVTASASNDTIAPGNSTTVTVSLVADTIGGSFRRHVDIFYNEKESPERLTLNGYLINYHITNPKTPKK